MVIIASDVSDDEGATPPEENWYGHVATQCTAAAAAACSTATTPSSLLCISL